ncbi:hypothetical protein T01_9628 [Trichinella spiralis]|uniref:Uncharacterized protein n=1 Tax=Trichinella spiralis TaxID=6334 RepID=A0A0V1BQG4_TRISP|nr:hypothetical protein T01_9628 [Trichinella spiralis]
MPETHRSVPACCRLVMNAPITRWGKEMALRGAATACYCPPPAFSLEMDLTEWMDTVEDFISSLVCHPPTKPLALA